ncbi:hypothetical protein NGUA15_03542 [Salmonella enterica]|nr:hypothetical protein NGUA15_03542 [Salmonella enterica]
MIVFLHTVQRAILGFKLFVGTQLQAAQQIGRSAEQRQVPAAKLIFHGTAQQAVQRNQRRFAVQTFAVRRVADHRTIRAFRQWITQLRHIFHFKGDKLPDTGATGVAARPLNDARIAVGTVEMRGILRQPLTRPGLRFGFHFLPDSLVMLRPAAKSPVTTVQSRRAIGRPHRGLNQQCPRTTHRVEQRRSWLPAGTHNNRCRQRLFNWRQPGAIAITAQVQAITTEIQRNAGSFFIQPDVNTEVR